jgi:hypothetical protein
MWKEAAIGIFKAPSKYLFGGKPGYIVMYFWSCPIITGSGLDDWI